MVTESQNHIAVPPGATIKDQLDDRGISQKEFARRMNMSEKHISKLMEKLYLHLTLQFAWKWF